MPKSQMWLTAAAAGCALLAVGWLVAKPRSHSAMATPGLAQEAAAAWRPVPAAGHGDLVRASPAAKRVREHLAVEAEPFNKPPAVQPRKGQHMKVFDRARMAYLLGEIPHCETLLGMASARAKDLGDREAEAMAELALTRIRRYRDPNSAKSKALHVKRLSGEIGHDVLYFEACYRLVLIHLDLGETARAKRQLQEPRFLAAIKTARQRVAAKLAEGVLALRDNQMDRAGAVLAELNTLTLSRPGEVVEPKVELFEAALLFARAEYDQAAAKADTARDLFLSEGKCPLLAMRALWLSCQIEAMRGNTGEADRLQARMAELADRYRFHFFLEEINRFRTDASRGRALAVSGETSDAAEASTTPVGEPMANLAPARFFNL